MSSDWWANQVGVASAATTPRGSVPTYSLAVDIGSSAPWPDQTSFNTWVQDQVRRSHSQDIQRIQAAKDQQKQGWFQKGLGFLGSVVTTAFGQLHHDVDTAVGKDPYSDYKSRGGALSRGEFQNLDTSGQVQALGTANLTDTLNAPGVKQLGQAAHEVFRGVATPFVAGAQGHQSGDDWWFLDGSNWSRAWLAADERTPGQAIADYVLTGANKNLSNQDLDRIRRTNGLYGLTTFATDMYVGAKLDPTVLLGKTVGEARAIKSGTLPRGQSSGIAAREATIAARGGDRYRGLNPAGHYGTWRGQRILNNFDDVWNAAKTMDWADFSNLSMFRRKATNGPQAALAFKVAANDPRLRDLTQRAVLADPQAWSEIEALNNSVPEALQKYAGSDVGTFIDAINATKTKMKQLDSELADLEKMVTASDAKLPTVATNPTTGLQKGFFAYYNKELHATYDQRVADMTELNAALNKYEDYGTWLENVPSPVRPTSTIEQVSARTEPFNFLSRRTYQKNLFGPAHTVYEISKGGWLKEANPIDLHRTDAGVMSIRRQFEQLDHFFGYKNRDALNSTTERFTRAVGAGDHQAAFQIAREVEEVHLVQAAADHFGLEPETVRAFMDQTKFKRNEMAKALLSGKGAVYSTAPGALDGAKLISREDGIATIELQDGPHKQTIKVPEFALDSALPVDPTQTPNWYTPLNTREVYLSIKRDPELFETLDSELKNFGRDKAAQAMEFIDTYGTKFNKYWKPLQLFRLAWPQRVLMDEGMRGMAVLGLSEWLKNYGSAFFHAANNSLEHNPINYLSKRRQLKIGPGPIASKTSGRLYDPITEALSDEAPFVPSYHAPKLNPKRAERLGQITARMDAVRTRNMKVAAIARAQDRQRYESYSGGTRYLHDLSKYVKAQADEPALLPLRYDQPINEALAQFDADSWHDIYMQPAPLLTRGVYDPIDGKQVKSGFAVPVLSTELRVAPPHMQYRDPAHYSPGANNGLGRYHHDLNDFIMANRELLSSGGYRVMFERTEKIRPGGRIRGSNTEPGITAHIVRVFRANERPKAIDFTNHVEADRFINLHEQHTEYVRDWNAQSPIMEELTRRFANEEGEDFIPGTSPATGGPEGKNVSPVYHGTARHGGLPDDLLPRDHPQVPMDRGNLMGQGFYSSTDREVAEEYGHAGLYTIRGSKSGKTYQVFDLNKRIPNEEKAQAEDYLRQWVAREKEILRAEVGDRAAEDLDYQLSQYLLPMLHRSGSTWADVFEGVSSWASGYNYGRIDKGVTRYLEDVHNAGALTHAGVQWQTGRRSQVYIWLHPEDLNVRPAYDKTGRFYNLEEWLAHPDSRESLWDDLMYDDNGNVVEAPPKPARPMNQVPESRIHRVGVKPNAAARQASGELRRQELAAMDPDELNNLDFNFHIDSVHEAFLRKLWKRRQFGTGYAKYTTRDGKQAVVQKALEGPGEVYVPLMSGQPAYSRLTDSYKRTLNIMRTKAVGYKRIQPPEVTPETLKTRAGRMAAQEYYGNWSDLLNDQVRNSPIWYKMLEGQTDEQITNWLRNTTEGARLRRELPHKGYNPERWVEEHRQALNFYLPDKDLQTVLRDRKIKGSELRRIGPEAMPEIYGPDLEMIAGDRGFGAAIGRMTDKIYHALGTVPTDVLSRQPFFKGMYDLKMRNLIRAADEADLTPSVIAGYEKLAREFALRQVKRTMYDLVDDTNFTQAIRFLAPFWGAQQEAIVKWFNIAIERPETVARFYVGLNQVYNRLTVVNEDGVPTKSPNNLLHYNSNDRVILQIPKNLTKIAPFDKMLKEFGSVGFTFGSANTAFQGDNFMLPSLGPLVTIPADKLVNQMWDTHATQFDQNFFYRWLFPVGRPSPGTTGVMEQIFPGWGRRMMQVQDGQDSRAWSNTYFSVQRELELDHKKRGLPPPSPEEVDRATKWHYALRVMASFGAPVQLEFRPKHQFYLDAYHEMIRQYGPGEAFDRFVKKYGADAARYAASSSTAYVPPTAKGMAEWEQNKQLIAKYPGWADAIISPDAWSDQFSSDAYGAQFAIKLGPGTNQALRTSQDPAERARTTDVRVGWLKYRQLMSAVNAELYNRGLTSVEQKGAEDLKAIKDGWVADMRKKNPAWSDDMDTFSNTIYGRIRDLRSFVYDKRFDNRPDIKGVRQYLLIRDQVAQSLDDYHATTGGSRSLQAQENTDLRNWFYGQVGQLIQDNPSFGEFYTRYLESDRLERGSGP